MSVSKINFNDSNEAYIVVEPISDIDREDFKTYLDLDSPSFLKCEFENGKAFTLYYGYGKRITLKQFLSHVVEKNEAINFLKSLTRAYIEAEGYGMNTNHILLGINSIFYNEESGQVSCVYVPVNEGVLPARPLRLFLKEMLVNIVYSEEDDMTWLGNTIRYISRNRQLSYQDFYEFLQTQGELDKEPVSEAEPETAQEEIMEPETEQEMTPEDDLSDLKSVLESIPAAESVNTLKFDSKEELEIAPEETATETPEEETMEEPEEELEEEIPEVPAEEPETADDDDLVRSLNVDRTRGVLLRRKNQAAYVLEQPEIRIGKSAANDICINDNPAVSRVHAIISQFDGDYVIQDNGSTNHTFVNGIILNGSQEKPLADGDRILLGNEEFIFKIHEM